MIALLGRASIDEVIDRATRRRCCEVRADLPARAGDGVALEAAGVRAAEDRLAARGVALLLRPRDDLPSSPRGVGALGRRRQRPPACAEASIKRRRRGRVVLTVPQRQLGDVRRQSLALPARRDRTLGAALRAEGRPSTTLGRSSVGGLSPASSVRRRWPRRGRSSADQQRRRRRGRRSVALDRLRSAAGRQHALPPRLASAARRRGARPAACSACRRRCWRTCCAGRLGLPRAGKAAIAAARHACRPALSSSGRSARAGRHRGRRSALPDAAAPAPQQRGLRSAARSRRGRVEDGRASSGLPTAAISVEHVAAFLRRELPLPQLSDQQPPPPRATSPPARAKHWSRPSAEVEPARLQNAGSQTAFSSARSATGRSRGTGPPAGRAPRIASSTAAAARDSRQRPDRLQPHPRVIVGHCARPAGPRRSAGRAASPARRAPPPARTRWSFDVEQRRRAASAPTTSSAWYIHSASSRGARRPRRSRRAS